MVAVLPIAGLVASSSAQRLKPHAIEIRVNIDPVCNAAPEIQKLVTGWMGPFYEGKEQLQRDEAMRSCGIAGQTIMLAAKAMGYDSCPMIGFDPVKVAEIINLPSDHVVGFMIAVGKAVKPAMPKGGQLALSEVVVQDRFA
jgi:nitroreductase